MQINKLNTSSFQGNLRIYDTQKDSFINLPAKAISDIDYDYQTKTSTITYRTYTEIPKWYKVDVHKKIPLDTVLAAYNAAISAPDSTSINIL